MVHFGDNRVAEGLAGFEHVQDGAGNEYEKNCYFNSLVVEYLNAGEDRGNARGEDVEQPDVIRGIPSSSGRDVLETDEEGCDVLETVPSTFSPKDNYAQQTYLHASFPVLSPVRISDVSPTSSHVTVFYRICVEGYVEDACWRGCSWGWERVLKRGLRLEGLYVL